MSFYKNKKVLVTGGAGMIGREVVDLLLEKGAKVRVSSIDDNPVLPKGVAYFQADLTDINLCHEACRDIDYVVNCIGVKGSPKMCMEKPASFFVPMLQFNTNMMQAALENKIERYVYVSSVGVYSPQEVFQEDSVWSTFPSPNDKFAGWAKRMGELQAEAYKIQYGWDKVSIVRPANVYGSFDSFDPLNSMVIPSLIRKASENDVLEVWGDGTPVRDFIHARDVARGILFAMENGITEPLNLGSGGGISIKELVDIIVNSFDKNLEVKWLTDAPAGDKKRVMDISRIQGHGFELLVPFKEGIKETIQWFENNKSIIDKRYNVFQKDNG